MENYVDNRGNRFYLSPGTIASLGLPWTGDPTGFTPPPSWDYGAFFDASCNAAMIEFARQEFENYLKRVQGDRQDENKIAQKYGLNTVTLNLNLSVPLDNKWYYHDPDDDKAKKESPASLSLLDKVGRDIGIADYLKDAFAITIKQPNVIRYFSNVTFTTDAETIADFKLLTPAYKFTGKVFFWTGVGISFYQGGNNLYNGNYLGASKNGADISVSFFALMNPATATFGFFYFVIDSFYPEYDGAKGWPGAMNFTRDLQSWNRQVIPNFNLYRDF